MLVLWHNHTRKLRQKSSCCWAKVFSAWKLDILPVENMLPKEANFLNQSTQHCCIQVNNRWVPRKWIQTNVLIVLVQDSVFFQLLISHPCFITPCFMRVTIEVILNLYLFEFVHPRVTFKIWIPSRATSPRWRKRDRVRRVRKSVTTRRAPSPRGEGSN